MLVYLEMSVIFMKAITAIIHALAPKNITIMEAKNASLDAQKKSIYMKIILYVIKKRIVILSMKLLLPIKNVLLHVLVPLMNIMTLIQNHVSIVVI